MSDGFRGNMDRIVPWNHEKIKKAIGELNE